MTYINQILRKYIEIIKIQANGNKTVMLP